MADLSADKTSPRAVLARELGLRSAFGFPILLHNEVAGVMCFFGAACTPPSEDLLSSFTAFGGQIRQLIERKQMERELLEISDREQLREAIRQTRAMASGLAPVSLHQKDGLPVALRKLADGTSTMARVKCTFQSEPRVKINAQSDATNLYHIAQEAVNNALKHGHSTQIEISLQTRDGQFELGIKDNGRGIVPGESAEPGMGLRIMKNRADLIGGALAIVSVPGKGTLVTCRIPCRH